MNKTILIIAMMVSAGVANADWESVWESPDLNTDGDFVAAGVIPSRVNAITALDVFSTGNPDIDLAVPQSSGLSLSSGSELTSLESFNVGNGDQYIGERSFIVPQSDTGSVIGQVMR